MWALRQELLGLVLTMMESIDFDIESPEAGADAENEESEVQWFGERGVQNYMYFYSEKNLLN